MREPEKSKAHIKGFKPLKAVLKPININNFWELNLMQRSATDK